MIFNIVKKVMMTNGQELLCRDRDDMGVEGFPNFWK